MARGSRSNTAQTKKNAKSAGNARVALKDAPNRGARGRSAQVQDEPRKPRVFDERTKKDITGVTLIVVALALLATVVVPKSDSGFVTSALSDALRVAFGFGAFAFPFLLIVVAICLLLRTDDNPIALRVGIGLTMLLISFMTILAMFTPGAIDNVSLLFGSASGAEVLMNHGGYAGAGIAWALLESCGHVVGGIIIAGVAVAGAVIIGFSVSGLLQAMRAKVETAQESRRRRREEARQAEESEEAAEGFIPAGRGASREKRGLFGLGSRRREREAYLAQEAREIPEEPPVRIRRADAVPHVPRDLSRPRKASQPLTTQMLVGDSRTSHGGPHASSVDMYWPADYAYGGAPSADSRTEDAAFDAAVAAADTCMLGGADNKKAAAAKTQSVSRPKRTVLPWEDEDAGLPDATIAFGGMQAAPAKPMTRKLDRKSDASSKASAPKTRPLKKSASSEAEVVRDGFVLPAFSLINHTEHAAEADEAELRDVAAELQGTLEDFNIMASVVGWVAGPTVTLFKVDLPSGVRVSRVMALQDDIALALAAPGVRIFAPIPGTNYVGIEVPNRTRLNVLLGDVIKDAKGSPLEMAIGKDVEGHSIVTDLAKMPHLLIGGTTGSGKSVAINAMIMSILMRATPDEVRFILIDPKRVEFTPYNGIPHLYVPVVTENKEAASALSWGVAEMERRLKVLSKAGVRNINQYNAKVEAGEFDDSENPDAEPEKKMPYIVIVIDELADLMMNVGKEVELSISRIAQLARAAGIHLIVATQRPSTNVVTGLIKANITNRIAFNVASGIDSRVILDTPGAEKLIGLGDMLFGKPEYAKPQRLQGCFISEEEIEAVVEHLKSQGEPEYHQEILQTNLITLGASMPDGSGGSSTSDDPLLWEAAEIVVSSGLGSTSNIQRRLSVGYSRAGRIMDMLEEKGIVGPPNGSKPREVLVDAMELESLKAFELKDASEAGF